MKRPDSLPDFTDPPLSEVVMGIQFAPVPKYASVYSMKVWELFKSEFPKVDEQPILDPQFEMFGGANIQAGPKIHLGGQPIGSRLWFLSNDESHLLQFQRDRFITNWRKNLNSQPYPRFEGIVEAFESNLNKLARQFESDFDYQIDINQVEITYINTIPVNEFSEASNWFSMWNSGHLNIEALNTSFNEVIRDEKNQPFARLNHQIQSVFSVDGKHKAFRLLLSYKGKPMGNDIQSAMQFFAGGREAIVTRFKAITTEEAHNTWGIQE